MTPSGWCRAALTAVVASGCAVAAWSITHAVKQGPEGLFFPWLGSAAAIAAAGAFLRPRDWRWIAAATPALVLIETFFALEKAGPTAQALALGFGLAWAASSVPGALLGCSARRSAARLAVSSPDEA